MYEWRLEIYFQVQQTTSISFLITDLINADNTEK